ncbi:MAG: HAD-IA family hydrolase, partial [Bacteroidota bacterium]
KGEHRLYGLTNWSAETFPVAKARYDFLHWFEGILVSGEEKMRKPHAPFYELLLERYNINPETAIFIDDSARNVKASNEVGLPAIRFEGADKLRKDLKSNGVLV